MRDALFFGRGGMPIVASARGFSLMELVIVIAVIGLLAAIAIPNYSEYVKRGHRTAVRGALLDTAQWLERVRTEHSSYAARGATLPVGAQSPRSGTAVYTLALDPAPTATTYRLVATPVAGGPMGTDDCGVFTIDQSGATSAGGESSGPRFERCWGR